MGPLKENPAGYDEFYALWAFLSHFTPHAGLNFNPDNCNVQKTNFLPSTKLCNLTLTLELFRLRLCFLDMQEPRHKITAIDVSVEWLLFSNWRDSFDGQISSFQYDLWPTLYSFMSLVFKLSL